MDDFPALMGLYAGARPPSANKRASSGTVRRGGGGNGGGGDDVTGDAAGLAAARARVNRSLVMRVEKIAATAQLWSMVPWSGVRRYERVHVKGITLRLKQVKGILNFSFVALNKKGRGGAGVGAAQLAAGVGDCGDGGAGGAGGGSGGTGGGGRRNLSSGGGPGGGGVGALGGVIGAAAQEQSGGGSMEDLDGIESDGECTTDTDELFDDDEDSCCYELLEESELLAGVAGSGGGGGGGVGVDHSDVDDAPELVRQRSRSSSTAAATEEPSFRSQSSTVLGDALVGASRKTLAPWAAGRAGGGGGGGGSHTPGERVRSMSLSVRPKRSTLRPSSSAENVGNLGVFKVLGEAFMRRFNTYSDQVRDGRFSVLISFFPWKGMAGTCRLRLLSS